MICEVPSLRERAALALVGLVGTLSSEVSEMETQPVLFFRRKQETGQESPRQRRHQGTFANAGSNSQVILSTAVVFM